MQESNINEIKRLNLIRILEEKDIKQVRLSEMIDVKRSYISALVSGKSNLGKNTIKKICKALNIKEAEFYWIDVTRGKIHGVSEKSNTFGTDKGGDTSPMSSETAEKILLEIIKINEKIVSLNDRFAGLEERMNSFERALKENGLSDQEGESKPRKSSAS